MKEGISRTVTKPRVRQGRQATKQFNFTVRSKQMKKQGWKGINCRSTINEAKVCLMTSQMENKL